MTRIRSMLALCATLAAPLAAQAPPQLPTFAASADVVKVDVVATDERGVPVRGLTRDDFTLFEDGQPQPVTLFEIVNPDSESTAPSSALADGGTPRAPDVAEASAARPALVIVFDEAHLGAGVAEQVRQSLREVIERDEPGRVDVTLASTTGGGIWHGRLPEERGELPAALERFKGARPPQVPGRITDVEAFEIAARRDEATLNEVYRRYVDLRFLIDPTVVREQPRRRGGPTNSDLPAAGRQAVRAEAEAHWRGARTRQLATLRGLIGLLDGLSRRNGPKAIVLLSEGFAYDHSLPEMREVQEVARRARASVHVVSPASGPDVFWHDAEVSETVDSRDAGSALGRALKNAEGAEALALGTGGSVLRALPALGATMARLAAGLRAGYLLGFAPADARRDGRYHKLTVKARQPSLRLLVRPGYYALEPAALATGEESRAASLAAAFDAAGGQVPLQLAAFVVGSTQARRVGVRVVAEVPAGALREGSASDPSWEALLQVVARERADAQYRVTTAEAPRDGSWLRLEAQFDVAPGSYQVQALLREKGGTRTASARVPLDVPTDEPPRVATPVLSDELKDGAALPRALRRFRPGSTLHCLVEVLDASADGPVNVGLRLEDADGRVWLDLPSTALGSPRGARQWSQPLEGLPEGEYAAVIRVEDVGAGRSLTLREPFEVVAGEP